MNDIKEIIIDALSANKNPVCKFRGLGAVTANNFSRLLMDYKIKHPEAYREIMEALFKKDYGAGLTHITIELDTDVNSAFGAEPSAKIYPNEKANVTGGTGIVFAADAKEINPEITLELLKQGEPSWIKKAFEKNINEGYSARYKWYIDTLESAYDLYGLKFDYINANSNETNATDIDWIIYFNSRLKSDEDQRYDYTRIKIIVSDKLGEKNIAKAMLENKALRNSIDVITLPCTTYGDKNTSELNEKYGKEIWHCEGIAPCIDPKSAVNSEESKIPCINSVTDITNRIINSYFHGNINMYEFNLTDTAYYSGSNYNPKQLISTAEPWSGYYSVGSSLWGAAHITHFVKNGWKYVDSACFENNDTTSNYMVLMSEQGDYTLVFSNVSSFPVKYKVTLKNMFQSKSELHCIETREPESGENYDENWFRLVNKIVPYEENGQYFFVIEIKPFSIMTVTTLDSDHVNGTNSIKSSKHNSSRLSLPYFDSFNYSDSFLDLRENTPLYTTYQGGVFEIGKYGDENVLTQIITPDIVPSDCKAKKTPMLCFGDDRWCDCTLKTDIKFDCNDKNNYVGIGLRCSSSYAFAYDAECGYQLRIYPDCKWQLKFMDSVIESGYEYSIDPLEWNSIKISAEGRRIKCYINKEIVCDYLASVPMISSGKASFYSAYYKNMFRNLAVIPILGAPAYCLKTDCLSKEFSYSDGWIKNTSEYFNFSNGTSALSETSGDFFTFKFSGENISLLGEAQNLRIKIEVDDKILSAGYYIDQCAPKQVFYNKRGLSSGEHTAKVTVISGSLKFDSIETSVNSRDMISVHKKNTEDNLESKNQDKKRKMKKSRIMIGAGIAAAAAGFFIAVKKIKNFSSKKLDK